MKTESHHLLEKSRQFVEEQKLRDAELIRRQDEQNQEKILVLRELLRHDERWKAIEQEVSNERLAGNLHRIIQLWESLGIKNTQANALTNEIFGIANPDSMDLDPNDTLDQILVKGVKVNLIPDPDVENRTLRFLLRFCHDSYGHRIVVFGSYGQPKIFNSVEELNIAIEAGIHEGDPYILKFPQPNKQDFD